MWKNEVARTLVGQGSIQGVRCQACGQVRRKNGHESRTLDECKNEVTALNYEKYFLAVVYVLAKQP